MAQLSQPPELSLGSGTQLPDLELARIEELLKSAPEKDLAGSVEETSAGDAMALLEAEATQAGEEAPEIPSGEPILPPPLKSSRLPFARLIFTVEATCTPPRQPSTEEQGVASVVPSKILVLPAKSQYLVLTKLVDDPMLTSAVLKQFQDNMKEC